jgi:hypothetical protein
MIPSKGDGASKQGSVVALGVFAELAAIIPLGIAARYRR